MTWDFQLNPATRDLEPGYVSGPDEIVQRLITRLKRELGEWFLNTKAGLPWYGDGQWLAPVTAASADAGTDAAANLPANAADPAARINAAVTAPPTSRRRLKNPGQGILGAKPAMKRSVELLIRRETLATAGVRRIVKLNALFPAGGRTYTLYLELLVRGRDDVVSVSIDGAY